MFRNFHRSLLAFALLAVVTSTTVFAQSFPNYRMELIETPHPNNINKPAHINNLGIVGVPWEDPMTGQDGVTIYDQHGLIGAGVPGQCYEIQDLIDVPGDWVSYYVRGIPDDRLELVGGANIVDFALPQVAFYADLTVIDPVTGKSPVVFLPDSGGIANAARAINNDGDIIVQFTKVDGTYDLYVTHRDSLDTFSVVGLPVRDANVFINNRRYDGAGNQVGNAQIYGVLADQSEFRYTLGDPPGSVEIIEDITGEEILSNMWGDINDDGFVCGTFKDIVPKGKGKKTTTERRVYRFGTFFETLSDGPDHTGRGMNNDGDVVGWDNNGDRKGFVIPDGGSLIYLDSLVVGVEAPFWITGENKALRINDRDGTGFGQIVGVAKVTTTTGRGRNKTTVTEERAYLLTPEWP